jgi:hypothetical protein
VLRTVFRSEYEAEVREDSSADNTGSRIRDMSENTEDYMNDIVRESNALFAL